MVQKQKDKKKDGFWNRNKYTLCLCLLFAIGGVLSYEKVKVVNILVDSLTNSTVTVNYEHHTIHEGRHFYLCGYLDGFDADDELNFSFYPNESLIHMTFFIETTDAFIMNIYEGVNVTGGTPVEPFNSNRNNDSTLNEEILSNPTVTVGGTLIYSQYSGQRGSAGFIGRDNEIILKENTTYMFNFISQQNGNIISYCGNWYNGFDVY